MVDLKRIPMPLRIEREFLIKFCIFFGDVVQTASHSDWSDSPSDGVTIYELKKQYWDGLVLLVENRHSSQFVHFHFRCTVSHNTLISRADAHRELFDVIPPNHRQIILTISRASPSQSFTIGHDFQYTLSSQQYLKFGDGFGQKHWPNIDESSSSNDIHLPQSITTIKHHS